MAQALAVTLHALGAEAAGGNGAAVDIGELRSAVKLALTITEATGSLTVFVETSPDGLTGWRSVGQFDVASAIGRQRYSFDECDRYVRARWTVGTSATFSVAGYAHVLFARRGDITGASIKPEALASVDPRVVADCLIKASGVTEDEIATSNPTPLTAWPESVTQNCSDIAVYLVLKHRGFNPELGTDQLIVKAYDDALKWFRSVAQGKVKPPGLAPPDNLGVRISSGNPEAPDVTRPKFSDDWGDFG